jgi:hypothetical protein
MQELDERRQPKPPEAELGDVPLPRWITPLFTVAAAVLLPWTLWLTFTLPSRHVTEHYDLAWVGFDVALACAFAGTSWAAVKGSQWLVPLAAATGTMLVADAWFDVVTSRGGEILEAALEAMLVELPLAAVCAFIVYDAETFMQATVHRYGDVLRRRRGG